MGANSNPFAGLDKALLRTTRTTTRASAKDQQPPVGVAATSVPNRPPERPDGRTRVRPNARTPLPRRKLVRHPFEFYEDQVEHLRRLSLEAQLRGTKASMSAMVREAVDRYLDEKAKKE